MSNTESLKYQDERDKAYGLAGMVITLVTRNGADLLSSVDLDGDADSAFEMSHEFFFRGNPRMAAKYVWSSNLQHLSLAADMIVGNAACRCYVLRGRQYLPDNITRAISEVMAEAGAESCDLAAEECETLLRRSLDYAHRLFSHVGVHRIADEFSSELRRRRSLSGQEALEVLAQLGLS